ALTGTNYSNNLTVSISDAVHEINNGRFSMELEDTYLIYQDTADHDQYKTVNFTYKAVGNGETTAGITADNFKVGWQLAEGEQVAESFAHPEVTVIDFVNNTSTNTITGKIRFQLGSTISATELQSGIIRINDTNSGFTRYVHVYTLQKFDFKPSGVSEIKLEEVTGVSRQVNGVSCQTYKMTLRIPGNYPVGLYPIRIRMATTTLNPYQVDWTDAGGTVHHETDVTVLMEGTENGDMLEDEQLAGMNFTTDANKWNSRAAGSPWNYWYTYRILSKPEKTTNGVTEEDNTDKTYTIYFDDVRQLRAEANRSTDIGLFLKIKYFGDAVTVVP
ncbi:MAG: hypothetical protein IJ636_07825, partial [Bacteroidales bacterium]|nr:hypothetical protein [Bacteroidales bacterium]